MKIYTHHGKAHRDEFIACCLLISSNEIESIVRDSHRAIDAESIGHIVVDVGMQHDESKLRFDHHQLDRDAAPTCSITLILGFLGIDESEARAVWEWLEFSEWMDSKGPFQTAKHFGIENLVKTVSPIETTVLRLFENSSEIFPGTAMWDFMLAIGTEKLDYLSHVKNRFVELDEIAKSETVEGINTLFIPSTDNSAVEKWIQQRYLRVDVIVSFDDRGEGLTLFRRNDSPKVDFSKLSGPLIEFAHKGGFIAKTKARGDDWRNLVRESATNA